MALTTTISTKELQRIAELAYEGKTVNVMLCAVALSGFTAESSVAEWQSVEVDGNGYQRFSQEIGTGLYSAEDGRYNLPTIDAVFTSSSLGYNYDRAVIYIEGEAEIHSIITEDPNIVLLPGQTQTYRLTLASDD
jgi:hypothetical protein